MGRNSSKHARRRSRRSASLPAHVWPGLVRRFRGRRVGVLGDYMLDRFIRGEVARISPEAPVPLVKVMRDGEDEKLGGAGNVVANLAALGARPLAVGVVGKDETGRTLRQKLRETPGVTEALLILPSRTTTLKTRIIARHHHVVRVDWEETAPLAEKVQRQIAVKIVRALPRLDALVVSDYDKGVITDEILEQVLPAAQRLQKPVFMDLKVPRRIGTGVCLVQVSRQRAEEIAGVPITNATLERVGEALRARFACQTLALTLGSEGMRIFELNNHNSYAADRTKPWEVFDVTGAGDTVLAVLTLALSAGAAAAIAARLANTAAGVVVGKLGTAVCTAGELVAALRL